MNIRRISATNFKNLNLVDTPFTKVTLILGENGVGKSNLLLLLHTLFLKKESPKELPDQQFEIEGFVEERDLICRGEQEGEAEVTLSGFGKIFDAMHDAFFKPGKMTNSDVKIQFHYGRYSSGTDVRIKKILLGRNVIYPILGKEGDKDRAKKLKAVEVWVNEELANATTYIPNSRLLKRGLVDLRLGNSIDAASDLENTLLRLMTDREMNPDIYDSVREILKRFFGIEDIRPELGQKNVTVPQFSGSTPIESSMKPGVGVRLKEAPNKWFDLAQVGTGIQQILVIITMIQEGKPGKIALIEEFESSLSQKKRNQFLQELTRLVGPGKPLRQVIVTSHAIFRPKTPTVHSIGPHNQTVRTKVNFRQWTQSDWDRHSSR